MNKLGQAGQYEEKGYASKLVSDCTANSRQPLLDCMIENSNRLESVEDAIRKIKGLLFGEYPPEGDNGMSKGQTSIEEQAEDSQRTLGRIENEISDIYERLTN